MGKYFMPSKEAAADFEKQAKEMGFDATTVNQNGELYVLTDDDKDAGEATRDEYAKQYQSDIDARKNQRDYERVIQAKKEAEKDAQDDLDDALPDESPIGKSEEELDEMEEAEDERLGRDDKPDELEKLKRKAEIEKAKRDIRVARQGGHGEKSGGVSKGIKTALNLAGVGKINKKAMSLYTVNSQRPVIRPMGKMNDSLSALRELGRPPKLKATMPSMNRNFMGNSPLGKVSKLSPLSVAALSTNQNLTGASPLSKIATSIGRPKGMADLTNPASLDTSKIARIAKQSATIMLPNHYKNNINKLKRG